jgi:hypothetical protein
MPRRTTVFMLVILVCLPAAVLLKAETSFAQRVAADCIPKPESAPSQGSHWYYRVDRVLHRQCWYRGPAGVKVQAGARQVGSPLRLPLPRPIASPAGSLAGTVNIQIATVRVVTNEDDVSDTSILRWPRISPDIETGEPVFMSDGAATSSNVAQEQMTTGAQEDVPLIWPVLGSADAAAAVRPQFPFSAEPARMLAMLVGAFAFSAMMVRAIFRTARFSTTSEQHSREQIAAVGAAPPAAATLADFIRAERTSLVRSTARGFGSSDRDQDAPSSSCLAVLARCAVHRGERGLERAGKENAGNNVQSKDTPEESLRFVEQLIWPSARRGR